ncbi:ferrous iron transport protein B [Geomonas nitrogeniifigens]|uniref:ferrous iron transport protein B n=1 Tax=Geomonas diazotrophica TaxID=2843197 RepID=UPI001C2C8843|nr:ferrous iron transport protein B [Geomonas nitrogeniifigens]QXE86159.1 ferrous iron transport protein B [Geomonas nitrogeniifigens]
MSTQLKYRDEESDGEISGRSAEARVITVAVAGNPNSGKSTLINAIAGTRLHVGNWAGVTVEKKEALFDFGGRKIRLVDLPGTYSLSPYSQEEIVARDYLVHERPDLIINVVDATNLERNLYLTVQIMELGIPVVMALNIYDEAQEKGYRIDGKAMEEMLGIAVVPTSATRKTGLDQLLDTALRVADAPKQRVPKKLNYGEDIEVACDYLAKSFRTSYPALTDSYPQRWLLLKLMEQDSHVMRELDLDNLDFLDQALHHLRKAHGEDIESIMADARYSLASGLTREVLHKPELRPTEITEKIDKIVLNRFLGIPIFMAAMWLLFKLTFDLSAPFGAWLGSMTDGPFKRWASALLTPLGAPDWTVSLVNDGVIAGVGSVIVFVPVIFAMMFFITFLEGSGYMARAAFVMDRTMHAIGLHGKSFIPMLLGFGCNVPGIYATRTLENPKDKVQTALLVPLMSCGARLPVYVVFVSAFFPNNSSTVIWSLYVMGILLAVLMGLIFKKTLFRGEAPMFIMELPPYRMPSLHSLCVHTWEKGKHFLYKAGTYIFAVSILVWFLLNLPWGVEHKRDSYLGQAGAVVAPVFQPMGFGTWEAASSLISGVIAKEIVVGTMGEIYAPKKEEQAEVPTLQEDLKEIGVSFGAACSKAVKTLLYLPVPEEKEKDRSALKQALLGVFTPLSSYAFMVFVLLYMPCVVAIAAMRQEFGTWKWAVVGLGYQTALAWCAALIVYQGGRLLGLGG